MTQEEKYLLLKDLCARLPYGVKASYYGVEEERETWDEIEGITCDGSVDIGQYILPIENIKPYLFPLSSMTDEQREELFIVVLDEKVSISDCSFNDMTGYSEILTCYIMDAIGWLNAHHFDYRGLIEKGLAIDATELNIY